jgi:hypothetical protein
MVLVFALGQEDSKSLPYCRYERRQQHWMPRLVPGSVDMVKGNIKCHSECGLIVQMKARSPAVPDSVDVIKGNSKRHVEW